jgi:long-chain acyl-CoA synthetase
MTQKKDIVHIVQGVIRKCWDSPALTNFNGETLHYKDLGRRIAKMHLLFEHSGVRPGDKVALCGKNSAQWSVAFLSVITYGAVVVPLLHEFKPDNIHHLVNHSDAKLFFVDENIYDNLNTDEMPNVEGVFLMKEFTPALCRNAKLEQVRKRLNEYFGQKYPERFTASDVEYYDVTDPDAVAVINYTSGSTGFSKGVMLSHKAVWSNLQYILDDLPYPYAGESMICMLPMAHMYGLITEMLHGICKGCHLYFLTRVPSPKVLLDAFRTARPRLIITVPLIIEKIIKNKVFPQLNKPMTKLLLHTPVVEKKILEKIRTKLLDTFGGNLDMMVVGGAGLNKEVEDFLLRIKFPITVGYGMTECAPLIGYVEWPDFRPGSCGKPVARMQVKVDSDDPENVPGELLAKGDNVMRGYYKNPEATAAAIDNEGWLHTGDMGTVDSSGYIYIRGRSKTMILGPSGQNIYPEEIEQKLNNMPLVAESLVIDSGEGRLCALIVPDKDAAEAEGLSDADIRKQLDADISELNTKLESYSKISSMRVMAEEFEKTPKHSIKRFLYTQQ